jgi:hypothetical protein
MRLFILSMVGVICFCAVPADAQQTKAPLKAKASDQRGTEASPLSVRLLNSGKTQAESDAEQQRDTTRTDIARWAMFIAGAALLVAFVQLIMFRRQLRLIAQNAATAQASAKAAESASMPFLFPRLVGTQSLYPKEIQSPDDTHLPEVKLVFENFGKTPAMLRTIRAELYLSDRDQLPEKPTFGNARKRESDAIVPGETRGEDAFKAMSAIAFSFHREITANEIEELKSAARAGIPFKRFHLIGEVAYDDFFGRRTTQRFAVKCRRHGWQTVRGGLAFNGYKRTQTPEHERADTTED